MVKIQRNSKNNPKKIEHLQHQIIRRVRRLRSVTLDPTIHTRNSIPLKDHILTEFKHPAFTGWGGREERRKRIFRDVDGTLVFCVPTLVHALRRLFDDLPRLLKCAVIAEEDVCGWKGEVCVCVVCVCVVCVCVVCVCCVCVLCVCVREKGVCAWRESKVNGDRRK